MTEDSYLFTCPACFHVRFGTREQIFCNDACKAHFLCMEDEKGQKWLEEYTGELKERGNLVARKVEAHG